MRHFKYIVRAFTVATAITTLAACEDAEPPRRVQVSVPAPAAAPAPTPPKTEVRVAATPPTVDKPVTPAPEEDEVDTSGKASQLIDGARAALDKGELDRALELARVATKKAPNRASA